MLSPDNSRKLFATDWGSEDPETPPPIKLDDVQAARRAVDRFLSPTPLVRHPVMAERLGFEAFIKLENSQPVGVFKIRGTVNLLEHMPEAVRARGLVTATRGNFGQALARAATLYQTACRIYVPENNNPDKNTAMEATGAEVVVRGHDFGAAWDSSARYARDTGATSVHPAINPAIVAGQGTVALEMIEQANAGPLDAVYVPVGGGSLAASTATVFKALSPDTRVVAVQAENAPAFHHAWHTGRYQPFAVTDTIADGLATRVPFRYTMEMMRQHVDDFVLVSEEEIRAAIRFYAETIHQLAEGGGAAALAAALRARAGHAGQRVGIVLSGGNIDRQTLIQVLQRKPSTDHQQAMPMYPIASLEYGDR